MAEGNLRDKANAQGLNLKIDSCGTGGWHAGEAPDPRSQAKLREYGLDISDLRARQFHTSDFEEFDLIYCMDQSNFDNVVALARKPNHQSKVKMILNESHPDSNREVPDPYYGGGDGFENVYRLLDDACEKIIANHL